MPRSTLLMSGLGAIALATLTACPVPASHYEIDVGPDEVFAADVQSGQFDYWILDASGSIIEDGELVVTGFGSVTVHADQAAGLYVTTPTYVTAPGYAVAFDGSVQDDAVFSYLDTDEAGFEDLRLGLPTAMFAKHGDMLSTADEIRTVWEAEKGLQNDALVTVAHDQVTGAQSDMQQGVLILLDDDDLDAAEAGTSGLAGWATDVQDEMGLIESQALADAAQAQIEADAMQANAPDPAALQAAIEDCLELEDWGDELEAALDKAYPDKEGDTWDGKDEDSTELDRDWVQLEANLETYLEGQEALSLTVQDCIEAAIGGEPVIDYTETSPDPYEQIGANATASAEGAEIDANAFQTAMDSDWADANSGEAGALWASLGWMDPATTATASLVAEVGSDMFTESVGGTPAYLASKAAPSAKADSSFSACQDVTPVFQINLAGLGFAVGTPFDDVIRGGDVENSFEVMWGGKGDDCINGLKGHELILGGPGNDELHGGDQHELILGGSGDDTIYAGEGEDYTFSLGAVSIEVELGSVVFGGAGDDFISGSDPDYDPNDASDFGYTDLLFGDGLTEDSAGRDILDGGAGIDFLFGQWDDDELMNLRQGRIQINSIDFEVGSFHFGGKGDDELTGSDKFDLMFGSKNDDVMNGNGGLDLMFAGPGDDVANGGDNLDLVFGGSGDDTVTGGDGIDLVMGNSGDDNVSGGAGALDLVFGNSGDDTVSGEDGFDVVFGNSGRDFVNGDDGLDLLFGNSDNDTVSGGEGIDLAFGNDGRDWITGGAGAVDLLFGNADTDVVIGGDGLDVSFGNDGDDWMDGEDGVDLSFAGDGDDVVFGGDDLDLLFASDGDDCIWGEQGIDFGFGGAGDDQIVGGTELDLLVGSDGSDLIHGDQGLDIVLGGSDADAIDGGDQLGILFGGDDDDVIRGGDTLDLMFGGQNEDCQDGGDGFDIGFGNDGNDTVLDVGVGFGNAGNDDIETSMIGFGGDADDVLSQVGTSLAFLTGGDGGDELAVDPSGAIAFVFGGQDDDTISATGSTPTSASSTTRAFVFGGKDADWIQASRGKSFAFGQKGDDTMSAEVDGTSTNDDKKDRHWGNSDSDAMFGDDSSKKDKLYRGSGSDPARTWDDHPSTSPAWTTAHAAPTFTACPTVPEPVECLALVEPPSDVGAK